MDWEAPVSNVSRRVQATVQIAHYSAGNLENGITVVLKFQVSSLEREVDEVQIESRVLRL